MNDAAANFHQAMSLIRQNRLEEALEILEPICRSGTADAEAWCWLGIARLSSGRLDEAEQPLRKAVSLAPSDTVANFALGTLLIKKQEWEDALDYINETLRHGQINANVYSSLGICFVWTQRLREAIDAFSKGLALEPDSASISYNIASAHDQLHESEEARRFVRKALNSDPGHAKSMILLARLDAQARDYVAARQRLEELFQQDLPPFVALDAAVELAKVMEKQEDYHAGFQQLVQAKKTVWQLPESSFVSVDDALGEIDAHHAAVNRQQALAWARQVFKPLPGKLVFLVGFPRSGTTLTEQILESHPDIVATHEVPVLGVLSTRMSAVIGRAFSYPEDLDTLSLHEIEELRQYYWCRITDSLSGDAADGKYVLDKVPLNIVQLSFIARIFPESRILVALRDPRDVCLSCYMQEFRLNPSTVQFLDLDQTGRFYAAAMGLWLYYRNTLELPFLQTRYEDMIEDLEGSSRRLLDFVGVDWNSDVTRYYEKAKQRFQRTPSYHAVTQPIYRTAVGRWRNYEDQLAPIFPLLQPYIDEFGYS